MKPNKFIFLTLMRTPPETLSGWGNFDASSVLAPLVE